MNNKNELQKWHDIEKEYEDLFEEFIKSDDEKTFSKNEVKKIIEAHLFKEVIENNNVNKKGDKVKNLLVTSNGISTRLFNINSLIRFILTYVFYTGFLLLINEFIYPELFKYKSTVFIIAFLFTIIDKFVRPFIFIADLLSLTILKIGLVTLIIYTAFGYFGMFILNEVIPFEKAIVIAFIVLLCMVGIDSLKRDSFFKMKYIDDEDVFTDSDDDE